MPERGKAGNIQTQGPSDPNPMLRCARFREDPLTPIQLCHQLTLGTLFHPFEPPFLPRTVVRFE